MTRLGARTLHFFACASFCLVAFFCLRFTPHIARIQAAEGAGPTTLPRSGAVPVLVELFTSEGCSSCPSADAELARLDREQPVPGVDVIALGEHVDYWDGLGWKDRFSSPKFTSRQKAYQGFFQLGEIYTPQVVVGGSVELNGTDSGGIEKAIVKSAATNVVPLELSGVKVHGDDVTFTVLEAPATPGYVNVYAALVDPVDTTVVRAGENNGRTLHHAGVVRTLALVGSAFRTKSLGERPFGFQANLPGTPESLSGMRLVVFVQVKHIGPVLGAVSCTLSTTNRGKAAEGELPFPANRCPE